MFSQILKGFALASALLVLIGASPATAAEQKLLSKSDVIELAANLLGADPWSQPHREDALNAIRDIIKTVGVDFRYSLALDNEMGARGLADHRIADAIAENFGPHPQLDAYYGVFLVGDFKPGRVVHDVVDGTTLYRAQEHSAPLGILTISEDGTFSWDMDGDGKSVTNGHWHAMSDTEKYAYEGGPAIVLESARNGIDYFARLRRRADFEGWIEFGEGQPRWPGFRAHTP